MEVSGSIKQQTINSAKWNAIERIGAQGTQFLLTLIMARILSPTDYGTIGMLAIFIAISQTFIDSGFSTALVRRPESNEKDFCTAFYVNVSIAIIVYIILFISAPWIADYFNLEILCPVLRVYSISLIINSLMGVQVAKLQIKLDFKSLAKRNIIATMISGAVGIVLAYLGYGVWALVFQNICAAIINLIFITYVCRWIPRETFSIVSFKTLGAFGSKLLAAGLLHTFYANMTTLLIGKFYTANDLGYYTRGAQFAQLPNQSINGVLGTVTYPILARIQDDTDHLISVYRRYIQITSLSIFIFSVLLCALAKPLILVTLTSKWSDAIIFLQLFAVSCMFDHLSTINLNLLKVKGRSDIFLRLEVIKKCISILLLICSLPFGVIYMCLSLVVYNQIALYINSYYTGKLFNYGYINQFKDYAPYLISSIVSCIPVFLLTLTNISMCFILITGPIIGLLLYWLQLRKDKNMIELKTILLVQIKKLRSH